jgi:glutamate-1-semialdehyde 2,1-aminomutase
LALAAGLAQLRELERVDGFRRLEELGQRFEDGTRAALKKVGKNYTLHRVGSMFCLFFTEAPIHSVADVKKADFAAFNRFFWGCLERGVYFAPSQYEAGFISLAHGEAEMERTSDVVAEVLMKI